MRHDMIPAFDLYAPSSVESAVRLAAELGNDGWILGGGQDSLDWFKDRVKRPQAVIDLGDIDALRGIRTTDNGLTIGSMTTLSELVAHPSISASYRLLAAAASRVASPQIRNMATLGGNLMQDTRCWYYRAGLSCYRAGGNMCYANTPEGVNREHCIFGADRCVAVSPSDMGVALVALDAKVTLVGPDGERRLPAENFFVGPSRDIRRMTVARPDEILVSIDLPNGSSGLAHHYEKVADRGAFDFALVSIAACWQMSGDRLSRYRVAAGGVECVPRRLRQVELVVEGRRRDESTAKIAAEAAVIGTEPLRYNAFKVPLLASLVRRSVLEHG